MRTAVLLVGIALLSGCDKNNIENDAVEGPESSPARDVQYFLDHPDERETVFQDCRNDPGKLGEGSECKTVLAANKQWLLQGMKQAVGK